MLMHESVWFDVQKNQNIRILLFIYSNIHRYLVFRQHYLTAPFKICLCKYQAERLGAWMKHGTLNSLPGGGGGLGEEKT